MPKILVADDEKEFLDVVKMILSSVGYSVTGAENGDDALQKAFSDDFDLILLDIMMPVVDGLSVCRQLKESKKYADTPIIFLSAKDSELEKVLGLEIGADDYIAKPFGSMELLARVKARLRNKASLKTINELTYGQLRLNVETNETFYSKEKIILSLKEFEILKLLFTSRHKIFSRDEIMFKIWDSDFVGESRVIDQHIKNIRLKFSKVPTSSEIIVTAYGTGYRAGNI